MKHQSFFMRSASAMAVTAAFGAVAMAASPDAGSVIGNQAVATYTNEAGDTITVTSNTVETIVQQVAGVTMTSNNIETIAPGGKAFLPHIITNDGNGADFFTLAAAETDTGTLQTSNIVFYPDANMDGVADSATPLSETPTLAPGEQFGVVIEVSVPSNATGTDNIAVTAVSNLDGTETALNTDKLTISNGAIVELVKSMVADAASGGNTNIVDAGDTVTIKLTYSSTGLAAAENYVVDDILDGRLEYVPGSARWSDVADPLDDTNPSSEVDDQNGASPTPDEITFDNAGQSVNFTISRIGSGRSGSVTFQAVILGTADAGIIENVATQVIDTVDFPPSNTASIIVDDQFAVSISDTAIDGAGAAVPATASGTDDDGLNDDIVTETGDAAQGGTVKHEFVLTNRSNQTDSLTLDVDTLTDTYPDGTTFRFVGADGVTPIIGSVGPIAAGDSVKVTLIATLPTDVAPTAAANYSATVTTTSDASGVSDISTATFTGAILASSVDLENAVVGSEGDGLDPTNGGAPWVNYPTDPGAPVTYDMVVQNNGPVSDSYNLSLAQALPAGWTVEFRSADGSAITNTGTIPAGSSDTFTVVITPPEDQVPGDTLVDIALVSSVSGQGDRIVNEVTVREVYNVEIIDDQTAQASPGGIVDMIHTITNTGNVAITEGAIDDAGLDNFSGALFWDANGNGVIDPTELVIDNFDDLTDGVSAGVNGLAPGDSISVIYRVQTPSTATSGVTENSVITLSSSLNNATATDADATDNAVEDRIVIISGDITLSKFQYIDAGCTGAVGTFTKTRQDVEPGQCIRYKVVAENTGSSPAADVIISDAAPAYTSIVDCGGTCSETLIPAGSTATVTPSNISSDHGTVLPGWSAELEFTVQVDE
ncbi:NEW3 domain-containing protein [Sulfitobacter sp. BSw21498]|uniref:NEW3 domain-containing protein n=1 Tax=Sulfitobacter sp. BSw21498 TaxID=664426 RepID=UPI0020C7B91C|nr:NEW3 domain-containing protein [Sulfitobacter sp. BSw21498]